MPDRTSWRLQRDGVSEGRSSCGRGMVLDHPGPSRPEVVDVVLDVAWLGLGTRARRRAAERREIRSIEGTPERSYGSVVGALVAGARRANYRGVGRRICARAQRGKRFRRHQGGSLRRARSWSLVDALSRIGDHEVLLDEAIHFPMPYESDPA